MINFGSFRLDNEGIDKLVVDELVAVELVAVKLVASCSWDFFRLGWRLDSSNRNRRNRTIRLIRKNVRKEKM